MTSNNDKTLDDKVRFDLQTAFAKIILSTTAAYTEELKNKNLEYVRLFGADSKEFYDFQRLITRLLDKRGSLSQLDHREFEEAVKLHFEDGFSSSAQAQVASLIGSSVGSPAQPAPPSGDDGFNDSLFASVGARSTIEYNPDAIPPPEPEPRPTSLPIPPDAEIPSSYRRDSDSYLGPSINPDPEIFGETPPKDPYGRGQEPTTHDGWDALQGSSDLPSETPGYGVSPQAPAAGLPNEGLLQSPGRASQPDFAPIEVQAQYPPWGAGQSQAAQIAHGAQKPAPVPPYRAPPQQSAEQSSATAPPLNQNAGLSAQGIPIPPLAPSNSGGSYGAFLQQASSEILPQQALPESAPSPSAPSQSGYSSYLQQSSTGSQPQQAFPAPPQYRPDTNQSGYSSYLQQQPSSVKQPPQGFPSSPQDSSDTNQSGYASYLQQASSGKQPPQSFPAPPPLAPPVANQSGVKQVPPLSSGSQ